MSKAERLFKAIAIYVLTAGILMDPVWAQPGQTANFKKKETGTYQETFDGTVFHEWTSYLHFDRLYRKVFRKKTSAKNVNLFDEVPDDTFFTNRHGRKRLSTSDLAKGSRETNGPDLSKPWTVLSGEFLGIKPGLLRVEDSRGDKYELRFDPFDHMELATASEVIASRFYHAFGYNVPQYTILFFDPQQLVTNDQSVLVDSSGFKKKLTSEKLSQLLLFLPQDMEGKYRASARLLPKGIQKGNFSFYGRRKNDPDDPVDHKDRREIRALRIFGSFLANDRAGETNTLDVLEEENGRQILKHYLVDFSNALGSAWDDAKDPMMTHEYWVDYGHTLRELFSFGWWKKPWQRRWEAAGEKTHPSPAIGYFDANFFTPPKFKTEYPYYALKDVSRADAFWAAKIIMSFSDEDIAAIVKTGEYSDPNDAAYVTDILIKRRNAVGEYWFREANPLERFDLKGKTLVFEDLAVKYGFVPQQGTVYRADVLNGSKKKIGSIESKEPALACDQWLSGHQNIVLAIRTIRQGSKPSPIVWVEIGPKGIAGITRED